MQAVLQHCRMGETVTITYALSGLSPQGGRWKVHHDILKANGKRAVSIDLEGALLNLTTRKLASPTPELARTFDLIPRTTDFEVVSETGRVRDLTPGPSPRGRGGRAE